MLKKCIICGRIFDAKPCQKTCAPECRLQRNAELARGYRARYREIKAQAKIAHHVNHTIGQVVAMAAERGISYGKMVHLLEGENT